MKEYDVIVIGAGPAGSTAAKIAAERALEVLVLEEHPIIGVPVHCSGVLFATTRPALTQEILGNMDKRVIIREYKAIQVFAPSGKIIKEVSIAGTNSYLIQRDLFDQDLARQAVNSGVDLKLNTRVTGFLRQQDRVIGVTTNSSTMPEVRGNIIIATDGIHSAEKGISRWAGLSPAAPISVHGISIELTRVQNIDPDVFEFHAGSFTEKGWTSIFPRDNVSCMTHFQNMTEFENVKAGEYMISGKIKNAVPFRMAGWSHTADMGSGLPRSVDDGLILAGSAANLLGILPAIISGRYAAETAVESVNTRDYSAKRLSKYDDLSRTLKAPKGFKEGFPFYRRSDGEIEKIILEMLEKDEFPRIKPMII
jgi:digeranylgeranylglycerophospholipid reductase